MSGKLSSGWNLLLVAIVKYSAYLGFIKMKWAAKKLTNTDSWFDWWDKSDPYLKFLKIRRDNTLIEVARTNVVMNNLNPSWNMIDLSVAKIIRNDNAEQKFKI